MIKASELRIGNYINYHHIEHNTCVVTHEHITVISNGNNNYHPIPLSEEWLLNFGFEKSSGQVEEIIWDKGDFSFTFNDYGVKLFMEYGFINPPIKFVHQLQNLYFALTGEELKVRHPLSV